MASPFLVAASLHAVSSRLGSMFACMAECEMKSVGIVSSGANKVHMRLFHPLHLKWFSLQLKIQFGKKGVGAFILDNVEIPHSDLPGSPPN